jgi:predicted transposase/invertase (TIGR01784 family)
MRYDNAMKAMCARVPIALCQWLGIDITGEVTPLSLSETAPTAAARHVDALVAIGTWLVVHIEFQTSGEPRFGFRMLDYRVRLYARPELKGHQLVQHVVMLGDGTIDDGLRDIQLDYRYQVHYLRDQPVEPFLADPHLAPLASLANVPDHERPAVLSRAAALIDTIDDPELREVLASAAADLALLRLDLGIIRTTLEDHAMSIPSYAEELAKELAKEAAQEAAKEAAKDARDETREQMVAAMLRHRFGPDERIPALARQLAGLDPEEFYDRCDQATRLEDLIS